MDFRLLDKIEFKELYTFERIYYFHIFLHITADALCIIPTPEKVIEILIFVSISHVICYVFALSAKVCLSSSNGFSFY